MRPLKMASWCALLGFSACIDTGYWFIAGTDGTERCDDFTCEWTTEAGVISRASSWHGKDVAYELTGTPARISRKLDQAKFPDCLSVEFMANTAKDATVELLFDFGADGIIDAKQAVAPLFWERQAFPLAVPAGSRHLRVTVDKQGPGKLVINDVTLRQGYACEAPAAPLASGSSCLVDASCSSGKCVLGVCSACGAGGCTDGSACSAGTDCASGACAAGVCRSCAATGSCGEGEGCSTSAQCASRACVFGSRPSLTRYPQQDGLCGECAVDADCAGGSCVFGQCATCANDGACPANQRCRYQDPFEAIDRVCVPRFNGILPRGALCEEDLECEQGLTCGGAPGRAKRCGVSCAADTDCGPDRVCGSAGNVLSSQAGIYELLPKWSSDTQARIQTCWPAIRQYAVADNRCDINAQCRQEVPIPWLNDGARACCANYCTFIGVDLQTGECSSLGDWYRWW